MLFNRRLAREHDCGRAIIDARSIAGRHRTLLDEDGLELREILGGGVSPNELVGFEGSRFAFHCHFDRHDLIAKIALCNGVSRAALALQGQRIRSEEHTSELQSLMRISYAVFCLTKKTTQHTSH